MSQVSDEQPDVVCPSCGGTGEDGAFHPCLQCHGDGVISGGDAGAQTARGELGRAIDRARVALAAFDDAELARALREIDLLGERLGLTETRSADRDG
jgi:hypothetical protein